MADRRPTLNQMFTRFASPDDAAAIAAIYNQGIEDRMATFETDLRSAEQPREQLIEKGERYPTIVVERESTVIAWAGAGPYRGRPCYDGVAEHSVYVERSARGHGAGLLVLDALVKEYEERGFWKLVSRIFPENKASLALHESAGFRVVGIYKRHAKLDGVWRDCMIVEKLVGDAAGD